MRIALVLKSGGEYKPEHVTRLQNDLLEQWSFDELVLLTDVAVKGIHCIPLKHNWPGWWSKLELFRPDIEGDLLYIDLDTVIVGSLGDILNVDKLTFVRDFYRDGVRRPVGMQSCMMYLPERKRDDAWQLLDFGGADDIMAHYRRKGVGDQAFMEDLWLDGVQFFQDIVPGQIVSYKVHCKTGVPPDARVICAHGKPKPWSPEWRI